MIMGRKTWESIPEEKKPLKNRLNVVISSSKSIEPIPGRLEVHTTLDEALSSVSTNPDVNEIHIIGGAQLFETILVTYRQFCKLVVLTRIHKDYPVDVFMPDFNQGGEFSCVHRSPMHESGDIKFDYEYWLNTEVDQSLIDKTLFA